MRQPWTSGQAMAIEKLATRALTWEQFRKKYQGPREDEQTARDMARQFRQQRDSHFELRDATDAVEVAMINKRLQRWEQQYRQQRANQPADATASPYAVYGGREHPTKLLEANIISIREALEIAMDYARTWPGYAFGVCYQCDTDSISGPDWRWRWDPKQQKATAS